jgi:hypothetical protein
MSAHLQPISEISQKATNALVQELGVVDTIRFLNQFRAGSGNYTRERAELFSGMSVQSILTEIKSQPKSGA